MTSKLIKVAPEETERRLDALSERYSTILSFKPKENAVKQELEKAQEASSGVIKVTEELIRAFPTSEMSSGHHLKWKAYTELERKALAEQPNTSVL